MNIVQLGWGKLHQGFSRPPDKEHTFLTNLLPCREMSLFYLPALSDGELVKKPHVVNQNIEKSDLVSKTRGYVEAGWMDCHTVNLLPEPLKEIKFNGMHGASIRRKVF